jgi:uncharacterized membrane protein
MMTVVVAPMTVMSVVSSGVVSMAAAEMVSAMMPAMAGMMMTAPVMSAHVMAVMASMVPSVVATVSRFGNQRHCQCRHQRRHENESAIHIGSLVL